MYMHIDVFPVEFKIDTGADSNIVSEDTFNTLTPAKALYPPNVPLDSPGGELQCISMLKLRSATKASPVR